MGESSDCRTGGAKKGNQSAFFSRLSWILSILTWTPNTRLQFPYCLSENRQTATFSTCPHPFQFEAKTYLCGAAICYDINLWEKFWELQRCCNKTKQKCNKFRLAFFSRTETAVHNESDVTWERHHWHSL